MYSQSPNGHSNLITSFGKLDGKDFLIKEMRYVFDMNVFIHRKNFFGRRDSFGIERIFPFKQNKISKLIKA
ncbi:MAG: hypothetical protein COZ25_01800 [Ignavibacteria bacterium CG_4_10_14_3_um_filter_37_18]|nr:MAG: hypothetical protein COZ25_01800 [Ignavibacteria bacterium CG_4_10_14_3_um_filter_37_18]